MARLFLPAEMHQTHHETCGMRVPAFSARSWPDAAGRPLELVLADRDTDSSQPSMLRDRKTTRQVDVWPRPVQCPMQREHTTEPSERSYCATSSGDEKTTPSIGEDRRRRTVFPAIERWAKIMLLALSHRRPPRKLRENQRRPPTQMTGAEAFVFFCGHL